MFMFDRLSAPRLVSAAGAFIFSALCLGAAAAPAHAAPVTVPTTISAWQDNATQRLDDVLATMPATTRRYARSNAEIGATIGSDGRMTDVRIVRSSGSATADAALLYKARSLRLTPSPEVAGRDILLKVAMVEDGAASRRPIPALRYAAR